MDDSRMPLADVYFFWLENTMKAFKQVKTQLFKEMGIEITSDQWVVLKRAHEEPGISQREIASGTFKDPASITRILDILEKRGWLDRRKHPTDRRNYSIYLSEEGVGLVEKILPKAVKMRQKGLQGISYEEQLQLKSILSRITQNFSK